MLTSDRSYRVLLVLVLTGLVLGLGRLVQLRFDRGDIYPPYSSLRADPLGAKALADSLAEMPGCEVRRHLRSGPQLPDGRGAALLFLGMDSRQMEHVPEAEAEALERFAREGGRVVMAFRVSAHARLPEAERARGEEATVPPREDGARKGRESRQGRREELEARLRGKRVSLWKWWGVRCVGEALPPGAEEAPAEPAIRRVEAPLPAEMMWRTALHYELTSTNWAVVYSLGDARPVVLEQRWGLGTVVLCADSYLFSNEGLRRDRQPQFLAWMMGAARRVWFDEDHLGVSEQPGVAALARRYRLHGLVLGLVLLAGLFLWRSATSLVPAEVERSVLGGAEIETGKEVMSGFINLLRRSVPASDLPVICLEEWRRSCVGERAHLLAHHPAMRRVLEEYAATKPAERDPVGTCRRLAAQQARRPDRERKEHGEWKRIN